MPMVNPYNTLLKKIWHYYAEDVGKSLIHLGALGWLLSATAQITMIAKNKDIDKKEKQFLVPQEFADGAINVGLYYTICQAIKKGCEQILESGRVCTQKTFKTILQLKPTPNSAGDYIKGMSEIFISSGLVKKKKSVGALTDFYNGAIALLGKQESVRKKILERYPALKSTFEPIIAADKLKQTKRFLNRGLKDYTLFKNGVGVTAAVGASVLACNLITPVTRNYSASVYQKRALKRQQKEERNKHVLPAYQLPVPNTFNGFKI